MECPGTTRLAIVLLPLLVAGCLGDAEVAAGPDPLVPASAQEPRVLAVPADAGELVLLVTVPANVSASVSWSILEEQPTMTQHRVGFVMIHSTPDRVVRHLAGSRYDADAHPVILARHGGTSVEGPGRPDLPVSGLDPTHDGSFDLMPGPNGITFGAEGLDARLEVDLEPPELWADASLEFFGEDLYRIYSSRNEGDMDSHTQLGGSVSALVRATKSVSLEHGLSYVSVDAAGKQGDVTIHTPTGTICEDNRVSPLGMMGVAAYGFGPGTYDVSALSMAPRSVAGDEVAVRVIDLPFWPSEEAPLCFG